MAACGNNTLSTGNAENNSGNSLPENLIILDSEKWPQNEYTVNIPPPESGIIQQAWIDPDKKFCYLELSDLTLTESSQYVESLKQSGFSESEKVSEEINEDSISVNILLTCNNTDISISYIDNLFGMYIKKKQ